MTAVVCRHQGCVSCPNDDSDGESVRSLEIGRVRGGPRPYVTDIPPIPEAATVCEVAVQTLDVENLPYSSGSGKGRSRVLRRQPADPPSPRLSFFNDTIPVQVQDVQVQGLGAKLVEKDAEEAKKLSEEKGMDTASVGNEAQSAILRGLMVKGQR